MQASHGEGQRRRLRSFLSCFEGSPVADSEAQRPVATRREGSPFTLSQFRRKKEAVQVDDASAKEAIPEKTVPDGQQPSLPGAVEPVTEVPTKPIPPPEMTRKFLLKKILKALVSRHHGGDVSAFPPEKKKKQKQKQQREQPPPSQPRRRRSVSPSTDVPRRAPPHSPPRPSRAASAAPGTAGGGGSSSKPASPRASAPPNPAARSCLGGGAGSSKGNKNQLAGLSILAVVMVTMLLSGRVSAILCTCVWLYFLPRLRVAATETREGDPKKIPELDLDSDEYKKRVVLEGLLQRNGRRASGFFS